MMRDARLAQELERWRRKYYDGLAQLERKEQEWRRTENILRQCISRLSLATESHDAELNRQLDKLRGAIRKNAGSSELEALIQSLSEHLVRLDQQQREHGRPPAPLKILRRLADGIEFPRGLGHKAKAYSQALAAAGDDADYQPHLQGLIRLIGEAFDWLAESHDGEAGAGTGGKGLLGRLFRREEDMAGDVMATTPSAATREQPDGVAFAKDLLARLLTAAAAPPALRARVAAARRREELQQATAELAGLLAAPAAATPVVTTLSPQEVLLQLLERLAVPAELHAEAEAIKTALGSAKDEEELGAILGRIADLVATMRSRVQSERAEVETFLKQLTNNLQELDMSLRGAVVAHRETVEDGRAPNAEVQVQMQGIEDSVRWAQNLEHLKQAVQERIDTVRRHMEVFRRTEDERIERAEREVAQLNARLRTLESETEALRGRLQRERNQALIDPLTEIANRLAYNERIAQEWARWKRYRSPLAFSVWDVDHFKRINDTYGHQAGDKVLRVVAKLLSTQVRETDFVARYGGEEFVILLPETDLPRARVVAEKIRAAVQACEFHYRGERVLITISCGLAQFRGQDDPDAVFARADAALYRAKAAGRNRCRTEDEF